eukprot:TRINITY_DN6272_c0_g1_i1.p1 TRINITY_DN6272_c0_g1~~TRINITY_DN6272_c0_g1_i1.p1  ORF type:complete len:310 (-),score=55.33 TRINITY_DN6272_c0_g1_i1:1-870(-)
MPLSFTRIVIATLISFLLSVGGYRKRSLSLDGAITAFFVGLVHGLCGYTPVILLGTFFLSASMWTRFRGAKKATIETDYVEGGQRNYIQVFSNGGPASVVCLYYLVNVASEEVPLDFVGSSNVSMLMSLVVGMYATANGDTWASEIGVLSKSLPVLVTSCRKVPAGTNGGLTVLGTVASGLGGLVIGAVALSVSVLFLGGSIVGQWPLLFLGLWGGLVGSLVDSFLGATLQFSGYSQRTKKVVEYPAPGVVHLSGWPILDNHQVNLIAILTNGVLTYFVALLLYPSVTL